MSAFCVFGVTYDACVRQEQKKVDPYVTEKDAPPRLMTAEEYAEAVRDKADQLFEKSKAKQVSPAFDAPQFANEWIAIAVRSKAKALKIMRKGEKVDDKGRPVLRNGAPVLTWVPHDK